MKMRANNSSISMSYVEMDINFKCVFIPLVHWNAKQEVRPATQAVLYSSTCTFLLYFLISTMLHYILKKASARKFRDNLPDNFQNRARVNP